MLTCIIVIAGILIAISGIVVFFSDSFNSITEVLSYAQSSIDGFMSLFPKKKSMFVLRVSAHQAQFILVTSVILLQVIL